MKSLISKSDALKCAVKEKEDKLESLIENKKQSNPKERTNLDYLVGYMFEVCENINIRFLI